MLTGRLSRLCANNNHTLQDFKYLNVELLDVDETDILKAFPKCFDFISDALYNGGAVLVHWYVILTFISFCSLLPLSFSSLILYLVPSPPLLMQ